MAWVCLVLMLGPMGTACGQKSQEVERSGYTVRFDCRGGVPEIPSRVVYGPFGAPDISPTKEGYLFVCWETEALEPTYSRNIIKLQTIDNHSLFGVYSKSKSF